MLHKYVSCVAEILIAPGLVKQYSNHPVLSNVRWETPQRVRGHSVDCSSSEMVVEGGIERVKETRGEKKQQVVDCENRAAT